MDSLFVTTPIFYANDKPHIGHAYAGVNADVLKRYYKLKGATTFFLTGTDEHGEKIFQAAKNKAREPQCYVDQQSNLFEKMWNQLDVKPDYFIRTTNQDHKEFVLKALQKLYANGDIYQAEYSGLYSIGQERFVTEKELIDGKLPEDKDPPQQRKEKNYFFRMEKYQEWLIQYLNDHQDLIQPEHYRNEVLKMLEEPIGDLSVSRPKERLNWGINIPWDEDHVTYVWFDALLSYVSHFNQKNIKFLNFTQHIIGKDILKTHTLFWLTISKALDIQPYKKLFVTGHLLGHDGRKMSKSLNNGIDASDAIKEYGSDLLRYIFVREIDFGRDCILSQQIIKSRLNNELSNDLGNLVSRCISMINKYRDNKVPKATDITPQQKNLANDAELLLSKIVLCLEKLETSHAVGYIIKFVNDLNRYINNSEPWKLAKQQTLNTRLDSVLRTLYEGLRFVSILLSPVMPNKMNELQQYLNISKFSSKNLSWQWTSEAKVTSCVPVLFPKLD